MPKRLAGAHIPGRAAHRPVLEKLASIQSVLRPNSLRPVFHRSSCNEKQATSLVGRPTIPEYIATQSGVVRALRSPRAGRLVITMAPTFNCLPIGPSYEYDMALADNSAKDATPQGRSISMPPWPEVLPDRFDIHTSHMVTLLINTAAQKAISMARLEIDC